jgi:hypothetical protein
MQGDKMPHRKLKVWQALNDYSRLTVLGRLREGDNGQL